MNSESARHDRASGFRRFVPICLLLLLLVATPQLLVAGTAPADAATTATLAPGFTDSVAISGLGYPAEFAFAPDGRVFVAERTGRIEVFDNLADTTPTRFADLSTQVYNQYDRGMLGITVDPGWPARPYVYVIYAYDGDPGGPSPKWGKPPSLWDDCPAATTGCVISNRLSRLTASGDHMASEQVLVEGWCQQFASHSAGAVKFGPDGALYATAGEGASYTYADYGQTGNACADPPSPADTNLTSPTAQGGALRAQSPRRPAGQPTVLSGTLIRVDPDTGQGLPGNPMYSSTDANRRRIVAYGMRNPFRFNFRPGTNEAWIGDVGAGNYEEIDRVPATSSTATNFGWPCYEGTLKNSGFDNVNLDSCESLYADATHTPPHYQYQHQAPVASGDGCADSKGSSVTGVSFYSGTSYPSQYQGALFFADYARGCIWYLPNGASGLPDPTQPRAFATGIPGPAALETGPGGDLFYVDLLGGSIHRITYSAGNSAPVADATATPAAGPLPLTVTFSAAGSTDPDGDPMTYSWDLNGDGTYGDSSAISPTFTYTAAGVTNVGLRVTDSKGATRSTSVSVSADNTPPVPTVTTPNSSLQWKVGDRINFAGTAVDSQDGALAAARLKWTLLLRHCTTACHTHQVYEWIGVSSGAFDAPDHEYPSYLELVLTATDSGGLTTTTNVNLNPVTAQVSVQSNPPGLSLDVAGASVTTPHTSTVTAQSVVGLTAPSPQTLNGVNYTFSSWSDGAAAAHDVTAPASGSITYTAKYTAATVVSGPGDSFDSGGLNTALWAVSSNGSSVAVVNQGLEISHAAGSWTSAYTDWKAPYDQTARAVQLQLKQAANNGRGGSTFGETYFTVRADSARYVSFRIAGNGLAARLNSGNGERTVNSTWLAYNATVMQWLRFRESGGTLYWEYASGTAVPGTWSVLAAVANPFPLTAVTLRLSSGSNLATTDTAIFDNVSTTAGS